MLPPAKRAKAGCLLSRQIMRESVFQLGASFVFAPGKPWDKIVT